MISRKSIKSKPSSKYNEGHSQTMGGKSDSFFMKPNRNASNRPTTHQKMEVKETSTVDDKPTKKPFDKKAWRLKKYSKKHKIEQWENQRKHAVIQRYRKTMKKDPSKGFDVEKIYEQYKSDEDQPGPDVDENTSNIPDGSKPNQRTVIEKSNLSKAEIRAEQIAQRKQAREEYKKKKTEKFKKLNQKTKKGQPVMRGRIELLLEEIQQRLNN